MVCLLAGMLIAATVIYVRNKLNGPLKEEEMKEELDETEEISVLEEP